MLIKKLLIIDPSDDFCSILAEEMQTKFVVRTCYDGSSALELMLSWKPDTVVINPILKELDGLTILQRAAAQGVTPCVLLITSHSSDYLEAKASQMNIGYMMMKTCPMDVLSERICDLTQTIKAVPPAKSVLLPLVTKLLEELGLENHRDGFRQIQVGIPLLVENRQLRFTKELYPAIGHILGTDYRSMEKTIRDAIQLAWRSRNDQVWKKYFPCDENGNLTHPTNKSFMLALADYIIQHQLSNHQSY